MSGWPKPLQCGCPTAGLRRLDSERHDAYHREIGGPATCFRICLCGSCPQYQQQNAAADALRRTEYQRRLASEGQRAALQAKRARDRTPRGATT